MKSLLVLALAIAVRAETWFLRPPLGLDIYMPVPETNAITRGKAALGRRLFFDRRLSRDGTLACASCHHPQRAFSDGRITARGIGNAVGTRNAPALINRGYSRLFFWDGRSESLEQQVLEPIVNSRELGLSEAELERRTGMKVNKVTAALATYIRSIRSGDSRFDRYVAGQSDALSAEEKIGLRLFRGKGRCVGCHVGPNFTDERFHNTGVAWRDGRLSDEGRFVVSRKAGDQGAFKTPTLREVSRTAPYMHDGSMSSLEEVVEFYSGGGHPNPYLDAEIRPRHFSDNEKRALVAFLRSLNGTIVEGDAR